MSWQAQASETGERSEAQRRRFLFPAVHFTSKFWQFQRSRHVIASFSPHKPVKEMKHKDGSTPFFWSTFSPEQVDIDFFSEVGQTYINKELGVLKDRCFLISWPKWILLRGLCGCSSSISCEQA
jgi:hypothetical protein